ncbi:hypothetical protein O6H91_06G039500 [Diphasiastrum complanatum]|uniref:Uncharacterized protein n=1 Tax=Diphasiastrum complanatum TaxID=34168 RepID=A0ACC2DD27_DIPCM|nr:hypothetical protein O6H91_06G039500 [Diphasiastrum complanatum]
METHVSSRVCDYLQSSHCFTRCVIDSSGFPGVSGSSPKSFAAPFQRNSFKQKRSRYFESYGGSAYCSFSARRLRRTAVLHRFQNVEASLSSYISVAFTKLRESSAPGREGLCQWSRLRRVKGFVLKLKESSKKHLCTNALGTRGPECANDALGSKEKAEGVDMQVIEGGDWNSNQLVSSSSDPTDQFWEQLSIVFRVSYAIGLYGGLVLVSNVICNLTGMAHWGGFQLCADVAIKGLGYGVPPMMILLFILDDEVVRNWPPARAIRDVEDEELMSFFAGMGAWQFLFVVIAGALSEELFFRVAVQGGLAHAIQMSAKGVNEAPQGLSALTGIIPLFLPFAQTFAAVLSAALTGSMYYVISSPRGA